MPFVTFEPGGVRARAEAGESLFQVGRRQGVPISTACVGKATCGLCRVKILEGEASLSAFNADERKHLGNVYFITKQRLSCQARLTGEAEVIVELPASRPG